MTRFLALGMLMASFFPIQAQAAEAKAVFAGGCFWCMEKPFDQIDGVTATISGYTGGATENPTYEDVSRGDTGHYEVVEITYDPEKVSYEQLLDVYWQNIDPLNSEGQFCDLGKQYRTAIFYASEDEKQLAEKTKAAHEEKFKRSLATHILPQSTFYRAEEYHQNYYLKNPVRYQAYRAQCQRDKRLEEVWGE